MAIQPITISAITIIPPVSPCRIAQDHDHGVLSMVGKAQAKPAPQAQGAYVVMACSHGLLSFGLYRYGRYGSGLYSYGLFSQDHGGGVLSLVEELKPSERHKLNGRAQGELHIDVWCTADGAEPGRHAPPYTSL